MKYRALLECLTLITIEGCFAQERLKLDALCDFDTDRVADEAYAFPADRGATNMMSGWLADSRSAVSVVFKAANVPGVVAAESDGQRMLLYNQFVLSDFEKSGRKNWEIAILIAHQLGHHASRHALRSSDVRLRREMELEADRFGGRLLAGLGASEIDLRKALGAFSKKPQAAGYPERSQREIAFLDGWHLGRNEFGAGHSFDDPVDGIPRFPTWPPPRSSAFSEIPSSELLGSKSSPRLIDAAERLNAALTYAGYSEQAFYSIPSGFAVVARIEQIFPDGRPKLGDERWPLTIQPPRVFSLLSYFRSLFSANTGLFRVVVFFVTSSPIRQAANPVEHRAAIEWAWAGTNRVPTTVGFTEYTSNVRCTALIYEFEQSSQNTEATQRMPSSLAGRVHLERSAIISALGH